MYLTYHKQLLLLLFTLSFAFALALGGSANQGAGPRESKAQEIGPENDAPLLDLQHAETTGSDQLKGRKRRNSLRQDRKIAELPSNVEPLPFSAHALVRLPPLPVEQSNVIILGKVTHRCAVLTEDKLGIYSEFTISVSEIFKDDLNVLFDGQALTASRPGGAIRFGSGRIQQYTVYGQGYPQQDKVYVLFLKRDEEGDYSILTGYEVTGTVVQPLDGKSKLPKNERDLQFGIYRGVTLDSFRNALQKALQDASNGSLGAKGLRVLG